MPFSAPVYIFFFLPAATLVYFLLNRLRLFAAGRLWLVATSLFFYGFAAPEYLPLLLFSILVNFFLGDLLGRRQANRRCILAMGVLFNIGLLGFFKYARFFVWNVNLVTGAGFALPKWALPLAISFYTFQQVAYLADCYYNRTQKCGFLDYCFFVAFFPQLIAGPIVRFKEIIPQYLEGCRRPVDWSRMATGVFIFAVGLFKKVIIADVFKLWADAGFAATAVPGFFDAWGAVLCYTFQLYFDFSGYSDMAIGAALLFNIRLPVNFNSPYKALDIQDFWRRWHITLSRWLRDYLYIPLGGNRKGASRTMVNLFITFLLAGLWHGAGWTFVTWGALHGAALAGHRIWQARGWRMPAAAGWFLTFLFVTVAWVFFRAPSMAQALRLLGGMVSLDSAAMAQLRGFLTSVDTAALLNWRALMDHLLVNVSPVWPVGFALVALWAPNSMQIINFVPYRGALAFRTDIKTAVLMSLLLFVAFMGFMGNVAPTEFIYFNF